jgi:hypothetical protein
MLGEGMGESRQKMLRRNARKWRDSKWIGPFPQQGVVTLGG